MAEFSSCLVKCSQALDRFLLSIMLPRSWRSEFSQRMWHKCTVTQNFRKKNGKTCAGREMRELLRRINSVGGIQFQWNWSVGTGSESEPVLSQNRFSIPTPSQTDGFLEVCNLNLISWPIHDLKLKSFVQLPQWNFLFSWKFSWRSLFLGKHDNAQIYW